MTLKILKLIVFIIVVLSAAVFISTIFRRSSENGRDLGLEVATSTLSLEIFSPFERSPVGEQKVSTTSENNIQTVFTAPRPKQAIIEVSSKSFEELINGSIIQLYCGYLSEDGASFSDISRGTGIIINSEGEILTNRHIIYDENFKKMRTDCFVLKSSFPNIKSEKPKIYYFTKVENYPSQGKFSDVFSEDKYYNDFAILKIGEKPKPGSKINLLLQADYASEADYAILRNSASTFNYFPIDWDYQPQNDDVLITLGYGVDASRIANQITSTIGRLAGNIDIGKTGKAQILLVESNSTNGFSGGALINPKSKGLIGLISWITTGDISGKYTVAIFRDFLRDLMLQDLNFDLKSL